MKEFYLKTWHTVYLWREQARRSRGRSGRLRAVADARKRLHRASRPDIAGSGVGHGAIPLCESASAMPERQRSTLPERRKRTAWKTLQPTAFPEVESLLEGLRKRLRMPAAWAAKDGIQPGLTAVNDGKAVNERDVLILLTEVNLEKPAIRYRTKYAEKRTKHTIFRTIICKNRTDNQKYHYLCSHQRWRI